MQFFNLGNTGGAFKFDGIDAITQDPTTGVLSFTRSVGNTSFSNQTDEQKDSTTEIIQDISASKKTTVLKDYTGVNFKVEAPTGNPFEQTLTFSEWLLKNNGTEVFAIRKNGRIETNQIAAAVVRTIQSGEIPVYNEAAVLKGYIKIFT